MEHKTYTVTFNEYRYNQKGETDGTYTVGDYIVATLPNGYGKLNGTIVEIFICEQRNIYSLKLQSGWCAHPNRDEVEIKNSYEQPA